MVEITHTRSNPMVDPALHVWGWEVPVYLFLGGLVAGMMIWFGWLVWTGRHRALRSSCAWIPAAGLVLLSLGMLSLLLDLEHQLYVWRLYTTFEVRSPMSWGSWILVGVYPLLAVGVLVRPHDGLVARVPALAPAAAWLGARPGLVRAVAAAHVGLGVLLGVYTGILLSSLGARPLWSSGLLGPLFLVSGTSTAAALVHLLTRDARERQLALRADNVLLVAELAFLALFLLAMLSSSRAQGEAVALLLGGPFAAVFWVFVVGLGLLLPLALQLLAAAQRISHTWVAPALVLLGGVALRFVLVYAGQWSHWPGT